MYKLPAECGVGVGGGRGAEAKHIPLSPCQNSARSLLPVLFETKHMYKLPAECGGGGGVRKQNTFLCPQNISSEKGGHVINQAITISSTAKRQPKHKWTNGQREVTTYCILHYKRILSLEENAANV